MKLNSSMSASVCWRAKCCPDIIELFLLICEAVVGGIAVAVLGRQQRACDLCCHRPHIAAHADDFGVELVSTIERSVVDRLERSRNIHLNERRNRVERRPGDAIATSRQGLFSSAPLLFSTDSSLRWRPVHRLAHIELGSRHWFRLREFQWRRKWCW